MLVSYWNSKGNALRDLKRPQEALAAYEQALALDPKYVVAWDNMIKELGQSGRTADAQVAWQKRDAAIGRG